MIVRRCNDWSKDNGTAYLAAIRSLRPDVRRRVAEALGTIGPDIARVEDAFAAKYVAELLRGTVASLSEQQLSDSAGMPRP